MQGKNIKPVKPSKCHLWKNGKPTVEELRDASTFEVLQTYENESHSIKKLLKCKDCGQLYFYEFREDVDYDGGNDAQYRNYIPVASAEDGNFLSGLTSIELLQFSPRLCCDFPKDADKPEVYWVME